MMLCQVMLSSITDDEDNDGILIQSFRNSYCGCEISTGRAPTKYSFHSSQPPRHFKRIAISNIDHFINVLDVNVWGHNLLTNSFNKVRSGLNKFSRLFISLEYRPVWICANDSDVWVLLF